MSLMMRGDRIEGRRKKLLDDKGEKLCFPYKFHRGADI